MIGIMYRKHAAGLISFILAMYNITVSEHDIGYFITSCLITNLKSISELCIPEKTVFHKNTPDIRAAGRVLILLCLYRDTIIIRPYKAIADHHIFTSDHINSVSRDYFSKNIYIFNPDVFACRRDNVPGSSVQERNSPYLYIFAKYCKNQLFSTILVPLVPVSSIQDSISKYANPVSHPGINPAAHNCSCFNVNSLI